MVKHHGVPFLERKQLELTINKSNKNDIKKILGYEGREEIIHKDDLVKLIK